MDIPVFLITGFLEGGKTSFIKETISDPEFTSGENTLLICCEDGIEEYDIVELKKRNVALKTIDDIEDLTDEILRACALKYKPKRVLIEYNGVWKIDHIAQLTMPKKWILVQVIAVVDAGTFTNYMSNMRPIMVENISNADLILFNRCTAETNKNSLRRNIKLINRQAQIIYESVDGEVGGEDEEDLPFDINADVIEIEDDDYGLWYMDAADNPQKYNGKIVKIKGMVYKGDKFPNGFFVPGRFAMTCCADDLAFVGFITKYDLSDKLVEKEWVMVTAEVRCEYNPAYKGDGPILYAKEVEKATQPEEKIVYFT